MADVTLGYFEQMDDSQKDVRVRRADRRYHTLVTGKTGTGKSTLLENMIVQDIRNGEGLAVIDPHGTLVDNLLKRIPKERMKDVVYVNPADTKYPVGFNLLETANKDEHHLIVSSVVSIFKHLYKDSWGPRLEMILANSISAVLIAPHPTLLGVYRMLVDDTYRKQVVKRLTDPVLKSFWDEFETYDRRFKNEVVSPVLNKIGQLLMTPLLRNIVGQSKSTINIRDIMESQKILLVRVSKGELGEDLFRYMGELHEGNHEPIVSKQLFDKVQAVLKRRGRPVYKSENEPQALCGAIRCGTCGMMITAEHKIKRQKNGNVHEYVYYRCTRKNKAIKCTEPAVRGEILNRQVSDLLKTYALPNEWADELLKMADKDASQATIYTATLVGELKTELSTIAQKLQRLLDVYLDQDIEREVYRLEKAELLLRKKSLEEKIENIEHQQTAWLEPLKNWVKDAQTLNELTALTPLAFKKSLLQKVFGLNLLLTHRAVRGTAQNQWAAIAAAHESGEEIPLSLKLERVGGVEPPSSPWQGLIIAAIRYPPSLNLPAGRALARQICLFRLLANSTK